MKQTKANKLKDFFIYARACVRGLSRAYFFIGKGYSTGLIKLSLSFAAFICLSRFGVLHAEDGSKKMGPTVHTLQQALQSGDVSERIAASEALGQDGAKIGKFEFQQIRNSEKNPLVRHHLNKSAGESLQSDAKLVLIDSLKNDENVMVRQGAAQSLGNYIQDSNVVSLLSEKLMNDSASAVRYACALSLGLSNTPQSLAALEKASGDSDPNLRRQAAFSLKRHSSKNAQKLLKRLQKDSDESVRKMAGAEK